MFNCHLSGVRGYLEASQRLCTEQAASVFKSFQKKKKKNFYHKIVSNYLLSQGVCGARWEACCSEKLPGLISDH